MNKNKITFGVININFDILTLPSKGWLIQDTEQQNFTLKTHHRVGNVHIVDKLCICQSIEIYYATNEYFATKN